MRSELSLNAVTLEDPSFLFFREHTESGDSFRWSM